MEFDKKKNDEENRLRVFQSILAMVDESES